MSERDVLFQNIVQDMSEGIITVGFNGMITSVNPEAEKILEMSQEDIVGMQYAEVFFDYEENDDFNQTILDAVYNKQKMHRRLVPYYTGNTLKQLQITTSYLKEGGSPIGIVAVLSDLSELMELRDSIRAMKKIEALNDRLELRNKLLSETFGRFLSDDIVKQLLDTPNGLNMGGTKKEISILMSDLRGFTSMSGRMDPEKLIDMLNHYLEKMTDIIQRHSGTIIEFLGDGIFAIFGAPTELKNHAEECVAAAIEMEAAMDEVNEWNREHEYPSLQMGIGINTGDAIVGNIGSVKRTKYGVMGLQVNLAGRIESYTVGGQILISQHSHDSAGCRLITDDSFEISPKGLEGTLTVYSVTGMEGRYNLVLHKAEDNLQRLHTDTDIGFYMVEGKHTSTERNSGRLVALSKSSAIITSDAGLKEFDNIVIDIGEELFAKVVKADKLEATVTFTAVPPVFDKWYEKQIVQ